MILLDKHANLYGEIIVNVTYSKLTKSDCFEIWPYVVEFSTPKLQTFETRNYFCW